eukprot:155750_1
MFMMPPVTRLYFYDGHVSHANGASELVLSSCDAMCTHQSSDRHLVYEQAIKDISPYNTRASAYDKPTCVKNSGYSLVRHYCRNDYGSYLREHDWMREKDATTDWSYGFASVLFFGRFVIRLMETKMLLILLLSSCFATNSASFIALGYDHSCVVRQFKAKCFGRNTYGQLGYGHKNNIGDGSNQMGAKLLDIDLGSSFKPVQIAPGAFHTCALSTNSTVKCWGYNNYGQLGYGDSDNRGGGPNEMGDSLPEINLGSSFIPLQIVAGGYYMCALSTNNKVKCWGYNSDGQLGQGDTNNRGDEVNEMGDNLLEIDLGSTFIPIEITARRSHTCALSKTNKVKCWGYNSNGQLGYGDTNNEMGNNLPEIDLGSSFIPMQIVTGWYHTCALSTSNKVKCWGSSTSG